MYIVGNGEAKVQAAVKEASKIVSDIAGIQLGEKQYLMVESRLKTRMLKMGLNTAEEYLDYLKQHKEAETEALLSLLTTHHTFFFREFAHFEHILNYQMKTLIREAEKRGDNKIRIWSAACSRGQEVYSIAMFFHYHLKAMAPHIDFEILGTDIDSESVEIAKNGVYRTDELNQSPAVYVAGHWIQGKNEVKDYSKARDTIKSKCKFKPLNLMKVDSFEPENKFDIIFCRNVFIYFSAEQIEKISSSLLKKLNPHGALILGVSESLQGMKLPVETTGPSIYQSVAQARRHENVVKETAVTKSKPLSVLCIDDSNTIHALLKVVLNEENGFVIKNRAMNGEEALKLLEKEKYDAITLDLHMPKVDGLSFLSQRKDCTPVIVVSSISRGEIEIAEQAIELGACDYVEKPTVENLINSGNEIRAKIKSAIKLGKNRFKTTKASSASARVSPNATAAAKKESAPLRFQATAEQKKIKTLIVDDSETIRNLLEKIISGDPAFEVIGLAQDSIEAEKIIRQNKPDLITLDIHMPGKNGVEFLKDVQRRQFIPTVMISALSHEDGPYVMDALSAGAIDYIKKPVMKELSDLTPIIRERLKTAANAKKTNARAFAKKVMSNANVDNQHITLVGASTGGTEAIRALLECLPKEIPPILIVQHIPAVFSKAFADRLNSILPFEVKEADHGEEVLPNKVLIAPGGKQMGVKVKNGHTYVEVTDAPPVNRHKPSVDYMFKSAYDAKLTNATAVVLTGMGADGASEISKLKSIGVRTIAQDEATSVIYGMPKAAAATGAVEFVLPLQEIGEKMMSLAASKTSKKAG